MRPNLRYLQCVALAAACLAPTADAADWRPVRRDDAAALSVDAKSIRRKGDQVRFSYMVDHARMQGYMKTGVFYRSLVIDATIRCKPRTMALGTTEAYSGAAATGVLVGAAKPSRNEARFSPIEDGTSDQDLWTHVCSPKAGKRS